MLILGTIVIRPDIACRVISDSTSRIKECDLELCFLVDKFLENSIINEREKRSITDGHTQHNYNERMDKLLRILLSSIRMDGETFNIFLRILREEGTRRSDRLAAELMGSYQAYATSNEQ